MIEFPEFCNMMASKMSTVNDEDLIRAAFRVLDRNGTGTIDGNEFRHLMTNIGEKLTIDEVA
jgi:calmodulin